MPSFLLWIVVALLLGGPVQAKAQTDGVRSAKSGVYTAAQAARGKDLYVLLCRSCHTPESHTGAIFDAWWGGKRLSDLFEYVQERMPKNEPASLTAQEYADVVAYLLRMNALPAGEDELPTDVAALRKIRIDKAK
ncbi:MAG TPA: cytochrome c [Gemmatimonadaceae bacterium]|nr:cytochrome c [Gemmatimonadaceae bacterium]